MNPYLDEDLVALGGLAEQRLHDVLWLPDRRRHGQIMKSLIAGSRAGRAAVPV